MESVSLAADRPAATTSPAFIGISRVKEIAGVSKATILRWMEKGRFPRPVIHRATFVRWDFEEVMKWRAEQFAARAQRMDARASGKSCGK
jgi:predicted DNA-binding transcriptional regulator AlpA